MFLGGRSSGESGDEEKTFATGRGAGPVQLGNWRDVRDRENQDAMAGGNV